MPIPQIPPLPSEHRSALRHAWREARRHFRLDWQGIHGAGHWARVRSHGLYLAALTGADIAVVEWFAVLHDSQRRHDGRDDAHGLRAADHARELHRRGDLPLDGRPMELLCHALAWHSAGCIEADVTVQVCWDADRLDLGRVGVTPHPSRLCTGAAKDPLLISRALSWARGERWAARTAGPMATAP